MALNDIQSLTCHRAQPADHASVSGSDCAGENRRERQLSPAQEPNVIRPIANKGRRRKMARILEMNPQPPKPKEPNYEEMRAVLRLFHYSLLHRSMADQLDQEARPYLTRWFSSGPGE